MNKAIDAKTKALREELAALPVMPDEAIDATSQIPSVEGRIPPLSYK